MIFPQNHIRGRCSTTACVKALVTLSTFQKRWDCWAWRRGKKKCGLNQKRNREEEKHRSWSTLGLYHTLVFISSPRRDAGHDLVKITKRTIDISRSGNCQYIVTSLHSAMRMPTNKSQASWAKQRGSDANPGASGNHLWHSLCSFSCLFFFFVLVVQKRKDFFLNKIKRRER